MFKKILIAVPMEQYPEMAIMRAKEIIDKWNSKIILSYVIEDNILAVVTDHSQYVLTKADEETWQKKMIRVHEERAREIVLADAEKVIGKSIDHFCIEKGMYSEVVIDLVGKYSCDLIVIERFPEAFIQLRILDSSPVHIWIERTMKKIERVGLFCTNANPNILAPPVAKEIAGNYSSALLSFFIFDPAFPISEKVPDEIMQNHELSWEAVLEGKIVETITRIVKEKDLDLVVIGRVKSYRLSSLFYTISRKISCNILFVR